MSRRGGIRRDPVCGKRVTRNGAHIVIEHEGERYALCCPVCQAAFERDPARYTSVNGRAVRRASLPPRLPPDVGDRAV